jgi:NitT/TauT family transport system permease protein
MNEEGKRHMKVTKPSYENAIAYRKYSAFQRISKRAYQGVFNASNLRRILSLAAAIILWHVFSKYKIPPLGRVPTPYEVLQEAILFVPTKTFLWCAIFSLGRVFVGFFAGCVIGIPMGLFMGWKRHVKNVAFPVFELLRPIPLLSWIPLSVLMFPLTEVSIVFLLFLAAWMPCVVNTMLGVENLPASYVNGALSLGSKPIDILWHVILPGALPSIFTGMAIGIGFEWAACVAAEMLAGGFGLGYMLWEAYVFAVYPRIILSMFAIGVTGYFFSAVIRAIGLKMTRWRQVY